MRFHLTLLLACAAFGACASPSIDGEPNRPNVVLILADDIGVECFPSYGGEAYRTPHIDRLAKEGVRFTNCHAQPLCTPSRVKLMTGRSNIRNYTGFSLLAPDELTIGEMMRSAGYATCVTGKWQLLGAEHYGEDAGKGTHPRDAGFDRWCLWQVSRLGSRYWSPQVEVDGELVEMGADRYGPDVFTAFIDDFIEDNRERPFFVYYPMALVHDPFVPTPDSADLDAAEGPSHFADMIEYMDRVVGRIMDKLEATGLRENTLVIFTSDNGTHRSITSRANGRDVRGGKKLTTNAGTHVPLVVSGPLGAARGEVSDDLVDFADFVPTLADACGFELATDIIYDGVSFWPRLTGGKGPVREWSFCYYNPRPGRAAFPEVRFVRDKRWKLYGDGRLFDVVQDPEEERPLARGADGEVGRARARLRAALGTMPEVSLVLGRGE